MGPNIYTMSENINKTINNVNMDRESISASSVINEDTTYPFYKKVLN